MTGPTLRCESVDFDVDPAGAADALRLVLRTLPATTAEALATAYTAPAGARPAEPHTLRRALSADGRLLGAAWAQWHAGGTATFWPSQWTVDGPPRPDPLLCALAEDAAARGCTLAQSLLPSDDSLSEQGLASAGFERLAALEYLAAPAAADDAALRRSASADGAVEFIAATAAEHAQLAAIVERTYVATLDCPPLNGRQDARHVLADYERIGAPRDQRWQIVRAAGVDVGCLLLADHPQQDQVELVYMGLVPEVRGRGWGELVALRARQQARAWRRGRVVLAVDAANRPAVNLYRRAGFTVFDRRAAWILFLSPTSPDVDLRT